MFQTAANCFVRYRKCSEYSIQAGNFEKAVACAEKEADVEAYCIGSDASLSTAMMSNGMAAQTWLGYVRGLAMENRRAADIRQKADFRVQLVRDSGEKKRAKNAAKRQAKKDAKMEVRMEAEKQAKIRAEMRAEKEAMMEEKKLAEGPKLLRDGLSL